MKVNLKKIMATLFLTGSVAVVNAGVCKYVPGSTTWGAGSIDSLSGNGMVSLNGTTVLGATIVNGLLNADDASFFSLDANGSVKLMQCTIHDLASIKGLLTASSTKFEKTLDIYSSETRLINSKINQNLHFGHTDSKKQIVYLDNFSAVGGDIIFDDGNGEVVLRGQSTVGGKIIGGQIVKNN